MWFSKIFKLVQTYRTFAILIASISVLGFVFHYIDSNGYDRAVRHYEQLSIKATEKNIQDQIEKAREYMQVAMDKQKLIYEAEIARVEASKKTEKVYEEVISYVNKVKIVPGCVSFTDDVIFMLNKSISNSNGEGDNSSKIGQ